MNTRAATTEEIVEYVSRAYVQKTSSWAAKLGYEHWTRETYNPRSRNGVSHRRRSRSFVKIVDGVPYVTYLGNLERLYAKHYTLETGKTFLAGFTIIDPKYWN